MAKNAPSLPPADDDFDGSVDGIIEDLRGVVFTAWTRAGITDKQLSAATRLSPQTISRFGSGETRSPHLRTAARLAMALDLEIRLVRRSTGEVVSMSEFGNVTPVVPKRRRR